MPEPTGLGLQPSPHTAPLHSTPVPKWVSVRAWLHHAIKDDVQTSETHYFLNCSKLSTEGKVRPKKKMPLPKQLRKPEKKKRVLANRYRVEKRLGSGNFGTAWLVTDLKCKEEKDKL